MHDPIGQRVPNVTFRTRRDGDWHDVTTADLFAGKKVVVFSLPGAFTPTCSSSHLPRYEALASTFASHGIDDVICVSVNDGFVMQAWGEEQGASAVTLLPDGNGEFTEGLGMLVDKRHLGFGQRSWRYSMLVDDGLITKTFVEPERPGDPFEVSDADTMLRHVAPQASPPRQVTVFAKPGCSYCLDAKRLLREHGMAFEEILLGGGVSMQSVRNLTGRTTVPQIHIDGELVGGRDDLVAWLAQANL